MKRFAALVLTLLISLTALTGAPALGEDETPRTHIKCGDYSYDILDDGTAMITSYWGDYYDALVVPDTLDGITVTAIKRLTFQNNGPSRITIPDSVVHIDGNPFGSFSKPDEIIVSPNHPALKVIDDEVVTLYLTNSKSPCFIRDEDNTYTYLVLPVNFMR